MHMKLASASAIALGLALSGPAFAQATGMPPAEDQTGAQLEGDRLDLDAEGPEAGLDATLDEDDPALAADPAEEHDIDGVAVDQDVEVDEPVTAVEPGVDGMDGDVAAGEPAAAPGTEPRQVALDELEETLDELGLEDRELFFGSVVLGKTDDGQRVAMLVGPEDFEAGEGDTDVGADFAEFRGALDDAGFEELREAHDWIIMQGSLEDHMVFAFAPAMQEWDAADDGAEIERGDLRDKLGEADIETHDNVEAKLFRAEAEAGGTIFFLVGPSGFSAGDSVELSEDELREKFGEAGLSNVEVIEDELELVRGEYDGSAVLAVSLDSLDYGPARY
jgi:hypothetical protein